MTVGEKIQKYRKSLGLSQEELGRNLLVSRQTISLWEKDQTVPTIDNLMRLRDIFGISVDEILDSDNNENNTEIQPNEVYRFNFTKEELNEIYRLQRKRIYKKPVVFTLLCIFLIVYFIASSAPDIMIGFAFGTFFVGTVSNIKGIFIHRKARKDAYERISNSTYEYSIFENYIEVTVYRQNEAVRKAKFYHEDVEQIQKIGKWLLLQFGGQYLIIRKNDLEENSAFNSFIYKNPSQIIEIPISNKWRTISIVLFVASLLSIIGAEVLVWTVSDKTGLFLENMWLINAIGVQRVLRGMPSAPACLAVLPYDSMPSPARLAKHKRRFHAKSSTRSGTDFFVRQGRVRRNTGVFQGR